jgi:hypothetical protein
LIKNKKHSRQNAGRSFNAAKLGKTEYMKSYFSNDVLPNFKTDEINGV